MATAGSSLTESGTRVQRPIELEFTVNRRKACVTRQSNKAASVCHTPVPKALAAGGRAIKGDSQRRTTGYRLSFILIDSCAGWSLSSPFTRTSPRWSRSRAKGRRRLLGYRSEDLVKLGALSIEARLHIPRKLLSLFFLLDQLLVDSVNARLELRNSVIVNCRPCRGPT